MITKLLERLAEMFPGQDYQSRLDHYITSKNPTFPGDIDRIIKEYDLQTKQGNA